MEANSDERLALAGAAVRDHTIRTPTIEAHDLSDRLGVPVHLKLECLQVTGSFKVRGAAARMCALSDDERARGVVTCSSGNHGRAVAHVAHALGISAVVCVPEWVDPVKLKGMKECGAEVVLSGSTYDEAEARAEEVAASQRRVLVHPFDDPWIIAGQGTVASEILEQVPDVESVVVPLSGGGLAGGIAQVLTSLRPQVRTIAASAANAAVMVESLRAGRPVEVPEEETLAGALSGGIGLDNRYTFDLVREFIQEYAMVEESDIRGAMRYAAMELGVVLEGGGAVALAALLGGGVALEGPTVAVLSGGNVAGDVLSDVLATPL